MYRKILAAAICTTLAASAWAQGNRAPDQPVQTTTNGTAQTTTNNQNKDDQNKKSKTPDQKNAAKLKTITVTGSLLPRSQIETATPTIQITNEQIKKEGFATVSDALQALPQATGGVQGAQFSGGFTQGAQTISLLGLPPGFTLFLIDGKPMADYPLLYNGSGNFVDISTLPMAMVDHIDIVPGNQSAIYGSSAIAGVVNIVLKQHVQGLTLDLRGGGFSEGGGGSQRLQLTGGHSWDKLDLTYSLELRNQQPIYRYQRRWFDSVYDSPAVKPGEHVSSTFFRRRYDGVKGQYIDPGAATCAKYKNALDGSVIYDHYSNGLGNYCGSPTLLSYSTIMNQSKAATGYINATYDASSNVQIYANILYNVTRTDFFTGTNYTWWGSAADLPNSWFYNANSGKIERDQRFYDASSAGIGHAADEKDLNRSYTANLGVRGNFGDSDWGYDAYFHRSDNVYLARQLHMVASKADHYFLGDQLPGLDPIYNFYPIYKLNLAHFQDVMTPAQYAAISDQVRTRSHTYTQEASATVTNTNLFDLPGGSAGLAMLLQYGNQLWENPTDPRVIDGYFWGLTGTQGHGKRDRYAAAVETTLPVTTWLTVDASARYDTYKASGRKDSKATYKVGLEWRPMNTLLIRGTYATAFRAPDMASLYQGPSGFYTFVVDQYRCREALGDHYNVDDCKYNDEQVYGTRKGNLDLKNITAKSITGGIVWSPTPRFNIHADYYRIKISNEVSQRSLSSILSKEADCLIGHNVGGATVDPTSPTCVKTVGLVDRNTDPSNPLQSGINQVHTYPINISDEMVKGVTSGATYRLDAGSFGNFVIGANYNVELAHTYQQYPGDPTHDLLSLPYLFEFKDRSSAQVTWNKSRWSVTVYCNRDGSMSNWQNDGRLAPWITYNASVVYQAADNVKLSIISNNVTNKRPPIDPTNTGYPYYDGFHYSGYGRSIFGELTWKFF